MFQSRLDSLSVKLVPLEHQIWRSLKSWGVLRKNIFVGFSGGLDSAVLLHALHRLQKLHQSQIYLAHVHHGYAQNSEQRKFRQSAQVFAQKTAVKYNLKYFTNKVRGQKILTSEEQLRDFRKKNIAQWMRREEKANKKTFLLALGHHADDLLETQMMRLVRGVGPQGFESMAPFQEGIIRPLIVFKREEVLQYAQQFKLNWLEDPSNEKTDYLRNWMRHVWLSDLEKKLPGSKLALFRSLQLLLEVNQKTSGKSEASVGDARQSKGRIYFDRKKFLAQSPAEQRSQLAALIAKLNIRNYSYGQIEEIRRRLDNSRTKYTFTVLKHVWLVTVQRVQVLKDSESL